MLELLRTIALLCQVSAGTDWPITHIDIDKYQRQCQQRYLKCVETYEKQNIRTSKGIYLCVTEEEAK